MDKSITTIEKTRFYDPEWKKVMDEKIEEWKHEVVSKAKDHAQEGNYPKTKAEMVGLICHKIQTNIQKSLDENGAKFSPVSGMVLVTGMQRSLKDELHPIKADLMLKKHKLEQKLFEKNKHKPNFSKRNRLRKLDAVLAGIAFIDAVLNYPVFRHMGFDWPIAASVSGGIWLAILLGTKKLGKYIQDATTRKERNKRYCISLIPYMLGFFMLAIPRADYLGYMPAYYAPGANGQGAPALGAFAIATLSSLLVWLALYIYSLMCITKEEQAEYDIYEQKCDEVKELNTDVSNEVKLIEGKEEKVMIESGTALSRWEFARGIENSLMIVANELLDMYKDINRRYRTDGQLPTFFLEPYKWNFRKFFDNNYKTDEQ